MIDPVFWFPASLLLGGWVLGAVCGCFVTLMARDITKRVVEN
jgi:hypothetical protein